MKKSSTPYDDVHRTMVNDCPQLLIPLVNEVFKEHYTGEEKVVLGSDAHLPEQVLLTENETQALQVVNRFGLNLIEAPAIRRI